MEDMFKTNRTGGARAKGPAEINGNRGWLSYSELAVARFKYMTSINSHHFGINVYKCKIGTTQLRIYG